MTALPGDWADLAGLDLDNVEAKKLGEYERVPAGNYQAVLSDYGPYEKDDKSWRCMAFTFTITDGEHAGETHRHSQTISYDLEEAKKNFAYVRGIFEDLGLPSTYKGPLTKELIEGARCVIVLKESKPNKDGKTFINLVGVASDNAPAASSAAAPASIGSGGGANPFASGDDL